VADCAEAGVGVVRRVTGGGAVLHGSDLTYCLAAPEGRLPEGLRGSYHLVADALIAGLRSLGVAAVRTAAPSGASGGFDCFTVPAEDEICAGGRKLVGSAQRRARGGVLQHGSIRLAPDPVEAIRAVGFAPGAATSLTELGMRVGRKEVEEALTVAFGGALDAPLEESALTASEHRSAERRVEIHRGEPGTGTRAP
jgi:lipoate-protein ligase A